MELELRIRQEIITGRTQTEKAKSAPPSPLPMLNACPLAQEKLDNLFYNQSIIWDGVEDFQSQLKSLQQQINSLKNQMDSLPTQVQLEQMNKSLLQTRRLYYRLGARKRGVFLPKLRLPQIEWTVWLLLILISLLPLAVILSALVGLWNS